MFLFSPPFNHFQISGGPAPERPTPFRRWLRWSQSWESTWEQVGTWEFPKKIIFQTIIFQVFMLISRVCIRFFFKGFKDDFWWGWFLEENILGNFFNVKKDPERDHKQWTFLCICQKYDWFHCFEATYSKDTCQFILKRTSEQKDNKHHLNKHNLPKTNGSPLKIGHPKRKFASSKYPFSGANWLLVSGRVYRIHDDFPPPFIDVSPCRRVDPGLNLGRVAVDPAPEASLLLMEEILRVFIHLRWFFSDFSHQ